MTVLGTGVDGAVRRLALSYDVRGQVFQSTSYDHAAIGSGSILNQVQKSYNDFEQLVTEYHSHGGSVNTMATPKVQYGFADGSDNTVRPIGMVYPNGRELTFEYGTANGIDDSSSRIAAIIDDDDTTLVEYEYLGQNSFVIANNSQPDLQWTLESLTGTDDPETGDIYAGLDRFGRITDCRWRNTDTEEDLSRVQYGYDRDSNRLWRKNPTDPNGHYDWLYSYDGLQRLKNGNRGTLSGTHDAITDPQFKQCWSLDATSNWNGFQQSNNGTDWNLIQSRTASTVNEITDITNTTGPSWATPAYDRNGNMNLIPQGKNPSASYAATYDAWNRLVKLTDTSTSDTVQENQYDARNFRVIRQDYANNTLSETRHFYYTDSWQDIEQRLNSSTDPDQQNVWGIRYIDDLVLRDRFLPEDSNSSSSTSSSNLSLERLYACQDANWNTTAIVDTNGEVQERYEYDPYGKMISLAGDFGAETGMLFSWKTTYCGYYSERNSTIYLARKRHYFAILGGWGTRDPLFYSTGANMYSYAQCNPIRFTDPAGTQPESQDECDKQNPPDCDGQWKEVQVRITKFAGVKENVADVLKNAKRLRQNR